MNKYNFKVSVNQFGEHVSADFIDSGEIFLIDEFEKILIDIKSQNKSKYNMLEVGSNQCFYSLMFKSILGNDITNNFMIEPLMVNYYRGIEQFQINNYQGFFINKSIGSKNLGFGAGSDLSTSQITIDSFINEYNIDDLDILHCDIDGSEVLMLESSLNSLSSKKINYLIILTHSWSASHPAAKDDIKQNYNLKDLHENCLNILNKFNYNIIFENQEPMVGGDGIIISKR
jgi:hypothetical protein